MFIFGLQGLAPNRSARREVPGLKARVDYASRPAFRKYSACGRSQLRKASSFRVNAANLNTDARSRSSTVSTTLISSNQAVTTAQRGPVWIRSGWPHHALQYHVRRTTRIGDRGLGLIQDDKRDVGDERECDASSVRRRLRAQSGREPVRTLDDRAHFEPPYVGAERSLSSDSECRPMDRKIRTDRWDRSGR